METIEVEKIMKELRLIIEQIKYIKENMPDKDMFLSFQEEDLLYESYDNEKRGRLISSSELRKELGI